MLSTAGVGDASVGGDGGATKCGGPHAARAGGAEIDRASCEAVGDDACDFGTEAGSGSVDMMWLERCIYEQQWWSG